MQHFSIPFKVLQIPPSMSISVIISLKMSIARHGLLVVPCSSHLVYLVIPVKFHQLSKDTKLADQVKKKVS